MSGARQVSGRSRDRIGAECPLLAISRHPKVQAGESALPPKADIEIMIPGQAPADVRFAPESGHKWLGRGMSAFDPKRTFSLM